jgi:hypothetical protein
MKKIAFIVGVLLSSSLFGQTILKDIPVITNDPYIAKVWAFNPEVNAWAWYDVMETGHPGAVEWYIEREISCVVDRYDVLDILIIRGFEDCADTTKVKVYGSYEKEVIKDKEDLRKVIKVDGGIYEFGTKIDRPDE